MRSAVREYEYEDYGYDYYYDNRTGNGLRYIHRTQNGFGVSEFIPLYMGY